MINTLSKIGWDGGGSTSIWIMSVNILFFFLTAPLIESVTDRLTDGWRDHQTVVVVELLCS